MNRRDLLKSGVAGTLGLWASRGAFAQQRLSENVAVLDGGGPNVVALTTTEGLVLVDSGAPKHFTASSKVLALFNTHYHLDQTGNNETFGAAGAKIIAHDRTRQWMSSDYWVPAEDRYEKARPKAARPTEVFVTTGSLKLATNRSITATCCWLIRAAIFMSTSRRPTSLPSATSHRPSVTLRLIGSPEPG